MRLLNTASFTLQEFTDPFYTPRYAILSHRWRDEEVQFHDIQNLEAAKRLQGMSKILGCCARARKDGYSWVWIDTCCIDKSSSSELSEAINSMYAWYRDSSVCYAYLDDMTDDRPRKWGSLFRRSEWFKRGWTLQELIAPARVVFFAQNWSDIGTRQSMADIIEQITDIDRDVLWGLPVKSSVARRMSWAANRQTTRAEDAAYSLMGLFGVNMPTLYGEGEKAFIRLQYEIMKQSNDHSIFAWDWSSLNIPGGLLALSPHYFSEASATIVETSYDEYVKQFAIKDPSPEHTMTNYGIRIRLPLKPYDKRASTFLAPLACASNTLKGTFPIGIRLSLKPGSLNQYVRERCDLVLLSPEDLASFSDAAAVEDVYLYVDPHDEEVRRAPKYRRHDFLLRTSPLHAHGYELVGVAPPDQWTELDTEGWCLTITCWSEEPLHCGTAVFRNPITSAVFAVVLGMDGIWERLPSGEFDPLVCWRRDITWSDVFVGSAQETNPCREMITGLNGRGDQTALNIQTMYQDPESKWHSDEIAAARLQCLDRLCKPLGSSTAVKLAVAKHENEDGIPFYDVDVSIVDVDSLPRDDDSDDEQSLNPVRPGFPMGNCVYAYELLINKKRQ